MNRAVFFDRDGVLNKLVSRDGGFFSPRTVDDFQLVPKAGDVINEIKSEGYLCIAVSNQPDVARGYLDRSALDKMTQILFTSLDLHDIFYCLHDDIDECGCRKPAPGLLFQAKEKWNIDFTCSLMVGDTVKDLKVAKGVDMKFYLLDRTYNQSLQVKNRVTSLRDIIGFLD
jgi:D-glycero-D-manno-heptose 1,7-bisphosphate phosphatase